MTAQITQAQIEFFTRKYTAYRTFEEMLNERNAPSLKSTASMRAKEKIETARLADAYDAAQIARGDSRRAWRG